ncbi:MAG: hypothetical protein SGJ09_14650 [Phycisphaerae bacterium]|nr:hypothetical protein [Phycisphaerae bacterium]
MTRTASTSSLVGRGSLKGIAACVLGATLGTALLTMSPRVDGCGGAPPQPVCGRTTTLTKAAPAFFPVAPAGGVIFFPTLVNVVTFGGGCAAPVQTTISLSIACAPPPGAGGSITIPTPVPGIYPVLVPVIIPAGPPRICSVAGIATTTWADGVTTSGLGDTKFCIVEPSPTNPVIPRLEMERLTPGVQLAHPGDQRVHLYRFTNNDPVESVSINLNADSQNTAKLGTSTGFAVGSGQGLFSLSDPAAGDNFPIGWLEDLGSDGCLALPSDPMAFDIPHILKAISLVPGETRIVGVAQRSWPMCACGSSCEHRIDVTGTWTDGSPALACAGAGLVVDCSVPPDFDCDDGGAAGQVLVAAPWQFVESVQNPAFPPSQGTVRILQAQVNANGLLNGSPQNSVNWDGFRGRMESKHQPPAGPAAAAGQVVGVSLLLDASVVGPGINSAFAGFTPYFPPASLSQEYFWIDVNHKLTGPGIPPTLDSFFDVFYTVELDGISAGLHRRAKILPGTFSLVPMGATQYQVNFAAQFPPQVGFPNTIDRINLHVDVGSNTHGQTQSIVCTPSTHNCLTIGAPGCSDQDCCTSVCVIDPFCCDTNWDAICVNEADDICYAEPPVNDNCQGTGAVEIFAGNTVFSTLSATTSPAPLPATCDEGSGLSIVDDIWYVYSATCGGNVIVSTCDSANYDTRLAVYSACPLDRGSVLACNDDGAGCDNFTSKLSFPAVCGDKYLIRVGGFDGNGSGVISINCSGTCAPPCPSDLNGDGTTNGADLAILLGGWGGAGLTDITGDGTTNGADLAVLLGGWGDC